MEEFDSSNSYTLQSTFPAISVIIPLYNTEKYIGECLESILVQTFQDFEVIVVDDCSTDSSCSVVESYIPKFDGRLKLSHMAKNSGCAPYPRNKGLFFSRGEYIYFMDADDTLTKTGLEEMYTLAKDYDADAVYCEKHYEMKADGSNIHLVCYQRGAVNKPTFQPKDLAERVKKLLQQDIWGTPWSKLVRRKLLTENGIRFQRVRPCDDHLWSLDVLFFSKKFLNVPNATYIWRQTEVSATRGKKTPQQNMNLWLESAILGLKGLDNMLGKLQFFRENSQARYDVLNYFLKKMFFSFAFHFSRNLQSVTIYEAVKKQFGKNLGEWDVLTAALITLIDSYEKESKKRQERINQLEAELKKYRS